MRAVIYTVYDRTVWTWRVSLDTSLSVDQLYWTIRIEDPHGHVLFRVTEDMPYGQAVQLAAEMNQRAIQKEEISAYTERLSLREIPLHGNNSTEIHPDDSLWDKLYAAMKGRSLLPEEFMSLLGYIGVIEPADKWKLLVQWAYLSGHVKLDVSLAISNKSKIWRWSTLKHASCNRCGHSRELIRWSECASCGERCAYCESCLSLGRARNCTPLIVGTALDKSNLTSLSLTAAHIEEWQLSPAQQAASEAGIRYLLDTDRGDSYKPFLIWAVTGAGKTEMIFPLVATELQRGGKVLVATPRRDVVLELLPRIKSAFPHQKVIALYGGSADRWELGDITLATTHQLIRYQGAFDLVVIDEIDAYPYHNNPILQYAAQKSRAAMGTVVLLSATPPAQLQADARRGRLAHVRVPVRYHGKPLPVPRIIRYGGIEQNTSWHPTRDGGRKLAAMIIESIERGAQLFIFVPTIKMLEPTLAWVRRRMSNLLSRARIEATSSQDEDRHDRIVRFRNGTTRILLTTTILERGVTIPKSDVIVLDADSALFDAAALVQMAGRAGRSAADPYGRVYYMNREHTRAQAQAVSQIRAMNRLAKRQGYLS